MSKEVKAARQRAVVAAVQLPTVSDEELESSLDELRELAKTLGFQVVATFTQKRSSFESTAYLGIGKREELRRFVQGEPADESEAQDEPPVAAKQARHGAVAAREAAKAAAGSENGRADFVLVDHEI